MKLRVVGWTYYGDRNVDDGDDCWAAHAAIVDDIKKHGYLFSGYDHQEGYGCTPVLNDGKMRRFSQRGFGGIMAEAHGYTGRMDYSVFTFEISPERQVRPDDEFDSFDFEPETDLNEQFDLSVDGDVFSSADLGRIKLSDLPELRYIDKGDTLVLQCGDAEKKFIVQDVDRAKDLTEEERINLEMALYSQDEERAAEADEKFNKTPVALFIDLKAYKN